LFLNNDIVDRFYVTTSNIIVLQQRHSWSFLCYNVKHYCS